jgi:Ser/Thr protein kinase RdoA (MazF antagonist)
VTGREFVAFILPRYNFRKEAADLILDNCEFFLLDEMSTRGGGRITYTTPCFVTFDTSQHEAAVHELAHAWWYLRGATAADTEQQIRRLLSAFLYEATQDGSEYALVRYLCRVYRECMWAADQNRWNHDEVFSGLASAVMGDLSLFPPDLRCIYAQMFGEPDVVYVPAVYA